MKINAIKTIHYHYGDEDKIKHLVYQSKEPLLIKIVHFTDEFSLDYFQKRIKAATTYTTFEDNRFIGHHSGDFSEVIGEIKNNKPHRIFGQILPRKESMEIEKAVPLWQKLPFRPKYFETRLKVQYFFGGKGSRTDMHFDREHGCNLHLCLSGKKRILLFTKDQSEFIYKIPFIGDSLIDFSLPLDELQQQYPRMRQAQAYSVLLEKGDMLFMPRNCWHFTEYLDAASSATYVFYPKKLLQIYGCFTGFFYFAYRGPTAFKIGHWTGFQTMDRCYAFSTGVIKKGFKLMEAISYAFFLPLFSLPFMIRYNYRRIKSFLFGGLAVGRIR